MSNQFVRGVPLGEHHVDRRISNIESFLSGLKKEKVTAENSFGDPILLDVIGKYWGRVPSRKEPPFWPVFRPGTVSDWVCTISKGIVVDHVPKDVDAHMIHELLDLIDKDGKPTMFPIKPGEVVYVTYDTDETGEILTDKGKKPRILIGSAGSESEHYDPPVGDQFLGGEGTRKGRYYHKLALFDVDLDESPIPEYFEAGNNIHHWRELSQFQKAGGTADIFKDYDLAAGKYWTRGITGGPGITVTQRVSDIEIKIGAGGFDADICFYDRDIDEAGHVSYNLYGWGTLLGTLCVRSTLVVGYYVSGALLPDLTDPDIPAVQLQVISRLL